MLTNYCVVEKYLLLWFALYITLRGSAFPPTINLAAIRCMYHYKYMIL